MCWKSKYKPKLEIADQDIPVQKVLDVKGDELWSPLYPFKWELNKEFASWQLIPIFNDGLKYWEIIVGFNSCSSIHMIDYNFARQCKNKFGVTVLATSNFRHNWKVFDCVIPKGAKYYKNEYEDYISDGLIVLKEEVWKKLYLKDITMIKERYVNLEVAMLLRDKGFDCKCEYYYDVANNNPYSNANYRLSYPKPTQQMACDWIEEKYKIHIVVRFVSGKGYVGSICDISNPDHAFYMLDTRSYPSIEPVYNEALKYILTNMI